ncbi:MAG: DUF4367 domain-containing protein [Lacrimispora sphenoides]
MKKMIAFALCAVMALSLAACSNDKPEVKDDPQKQTSNVEIPSPWVDCETIADAEKLAGFTVIHPKTIPDGYTQKTIEAVKDDMIQIIYENGEDQIVFRQAKGSDDISGDHTEYKESNTLTIGTLKVDVKGNGGKINLATWVNGEYSFAVSANLGGKGLDNQAINDMISGMDTNSASIGDVEIPSPWIGFETIADAEKFAGFTVILPSKMPEGYASKTIEAVENDSVQVFYDNGDNTITIRKAKGNKDISGDYNEYSENKTLTVGSLEVSTRGNNGKVNVATWVDGEYTYAVFVGFGEAGLDAAALSDMISGIR